MIFNRGMIIRHKKWEDVAFRVTDALVEFGRYQVWGQWVNMGQEKTWVITAGSHIKIQGESVDEGNWYYCLEPSAKCVRKEKWLRF